MDLSGSAEYEYFKFRGHHLVFSTSGLGVYHCLAGITTSLKNHFQTVLPNSIAIFTTETLVLENKVVAVEIKLLSCLQAFNVSKSERPSQVSKFPSQSRVTK